MLLANSGFLSPNVDDALRLVIVVLAAVNVIVLLVTVRALNQCTRLLLDVEQFAREVRIQTRAQREAARSDV